MLGAAVFFAFSARPRPHRPKGARLLVPTSWIPTRPLPHHSFAHHQQKARAASRIGLAQSAFWRGDFLLLLLLARSQSILDYLYEPSHRIVVAAVAPPAQHLPLRTCLALELELLCRHTIYHGALRVLSCVDRHITFSFLFHSLSARLISPWPPNRLDCTAAV